MVVFTKKILSILQYFARSCARVHVVYRGKDVAYVATRIKVFCVQWFIRNSVTNRQTKLLSIL